MRFSLRYCEAMRFKIGLAQTDCVLGDEAKNLEKARSLISKAATENVQLIVFPEMYLTGYALQDALQHAQLPDGPFLTEVRQMAKHDRMAIALGYPELDRQSGKIYNSICLVDKDGSLRGIQRKTHLYGNEKALFQAGDKIQSFDTSLGRIGIMICYDLYFPETARSLALTGAEIILAPSADWFPLDKLVDRLITARAAENSVYVLYCNRVGNEAEFHFFGRSRILDPRGGTLGEATEHEELLTGEVDLTLVSHVREETGLLKDRRPQVYVQ
jgi:predicted amidohydrolase